jgi:hypothetical protein
MTLVWTPGFNYDTNASAYIDAVEAADGQALETATRYAINDFVIGCKNDGIWNAVKASCILAGARTLTGALVPLVGTAPTNNNFVSGDYNRKTGLAGNGSTKYLISNINSGTSNSDHVSAYITEGVNTTARFIGTFATTAGRIEISWNTANSLLVACQNLGGDFTRTHARTLGLAGVSSNFTAFTIATRGGGTSIIAGSFARAVLTSAIHIFRHSSSYYPGRIAFYSIGESLDLALLDARVTALINAFAAAIP